MEKELNSPSLTGAEGKTFQIIDEAQTDWNKEQRRRLKRLSDWEGGTSHETAQLPDSLTTMMMFIRNSANFCYLRAYRQLTLPKLDQVMSSISDEL
jgi:hypothetical protein